MGCAAAGEYVDHALARLLHKGGGIGIGGKALQLLQPVGFNGGFMEREDLLRPDKDRLDEISVGRQGGDKVAGLDTVRRKVCLLRTEIILDLAPGSRAF